MAALSAADAAAAAALAERGGRREARGAEATAAPSGVAGYSPSALRELTVEVPNGAKPGQTKLRVSPQGEGFSLEVAVPPEAAVGDRLILQEQPDGGWACCLQRLGAAASPEGGDDRPLTVRLPSMPLDAQACFQNMVAAARDAGAFISPKLQRSASLAIPGVVACEAISEGEVLIRMPAGLHISPETCCQVMPRLHAAVEATAAINESRRAEIAQTSCLAALLRVVEGRIQTQRGVADGGAGVQPRWRAPELWYHYAAALLGEKFQGHPYWRALKEPDVLRAQFEPSGEAEYAKMMAGDAIALHEIVTQAVSPEVMDPHFDVGVFLQARLSLLTREFGTPRGSALVPVVDFCNHSQSPGARQKWSFEGDAMILTALRAHDPGDEVLISYGQHSSPLLLRTYGFTLPPSEEPNWTYACLASDVIEVCREICSQHGSQRPAEAVAESFLPLAEVHLDCTGINASFATALRAFARGGGDAEALLRAFCERKRSLYERSPGLLPALEQLRRARAADARSPAWWEFGGGEDEASRVKMSEYLCLVAHIEALDLAAKSGLREGECLRPAVGLAASILRLRAELEAASCGDQTASATEN